MDSQTVYLLPRFTETTSTINSFIDDDRIPEYKGHDEEWEWKQLPFNTNNEYNYSQAMEYDSMNDFEPLTIQDEIDNMTAIYSIPLNNYDSVSNRFFDTREAHFYNFINDDDFPF